MRRLPTDLCIVDAHCDTLFTAPRQGRRLAEASERGHLDLPRLKAGGVSLQFFALFSAPEFGPAGFTLKALEMIDHFYEATQEDPDLWPLLWREDVPLVGQGKVAGLLSIEGAEPLGGSVAALRAFHRLGVRAVGLTWNYRNELADGQLEAESRGGLTSKGRAIVQEMARLGMLIDVSHLSDTGFEHVLETVSGPVIASHSNARAVCNHLRNLTDNQIRALATCGGVMGMNFAPYFLREGAHASIDDVIRHIDHIAALVGPRYIGLGSDYDGIEATPRGLEHPGRLLDLADRLLRRGYGEEDVRLIMGGNFLRVLAKVLPSKKV